MKPHQRYLSLLEELERLKALNGITYDIEVVVVTKYAQESQIVDLLENAPVKHIGENRVQEAERKFSYLSSLNLLKGVKKHMLGPIQSNKIPKIVKLFDFVQSIEDLSELEALVKRNFSGEILVEVKTSYESTKHGIEVEKVEDFFGILVEKGINPSGLMTIAPFTDNELEIGKSFSTLRVLKERIERSFGLVLKYLSMGMTNDYRIAVKEGSNMLRIGSLIFNG